MARTTSEEKEVRRDAEVSPTDGIIAKEAPVGGSDAGPERHREKEQGSKENTEESPQEQTKRSAPPQAKNTAKQPSHVPGGAWLHKVWTYWKEGQAAAKRHSRGPGEGEARGKPSNKRNK
ncbi:hypothetical protein NDU88_005713 [Pleurodeles waltl]|uniref:Uncharacterized protein n=1 Tax=Pleurodeles waltl TaxID=8319 RepID=A0AAV7QLF9_PLEWA|nr:hypothetical protein NDU88_005713 [Pleurodeles waltl]